MAGSRPFALLVTHGILGEELVRTVGAILGPQTDTITISNSGLSSDALTTAIERRLSEIPSDAPVVLFTDLAAGSCGIASRRVAPSERPFRRITGVNLPMLLEFFHYRDTLSLDELLPRMEAKAKAGILVLQPVPLLLARIDDRLIHGQVAYGWGRELKPSFFLVVSDALRADAMRAEVCLCGVPDDARGRVVSVAEALTPSIQAEIDQERTILLVPGTDEAVRLLDGGFPMTELNVGGLHHAPGKREILPYVFLDDTDKERLQAIAARGVRVAARDLPANPSHPFESWKGADSRDRGR